MELLLDDYEYSLNFSLSEYSMKESKKKWNILKTNCENGNNESFVNEMISTCKSLTFTNSLEGGIEYITKKACRFRYSLTNDYDDNNIILRYFTNSISDKWTYTELDNLISLFEKVANKYIGGVYVTGSIVMIKKDRILDDQDTDSDF